MFGFRNRTPQTEFRVGQKVTVITPDNWRADGTGGAPGEVIEVGRAYVEVLWNDGGASARNTEFSRRSQRARFATDAWFVTEDRRSSGDLIETTD